MTYSSLSNNSCAGASLFEKFATFCALLAILLFPATTALAYQETDELPSVGISEAPSVRVENMGLVDGLAQGSIYEFMQDRHGYIWFGTQGGLHRYDGHEFKIYAPVAYDTTSMLDSLY